MELGGRDHISPTFTAPLIQFPTTFDLEESGFRFLILHLSFLVMVGNKSRPVIDIGAAKSPKSPIYICYNTTSDIAGPGERPRGFEQNKLGRGGSLRSCSLRSLISIRRSWEHSELGRG